MQRVLVDAQWAPGTTAAVYLADLRAGIRHEAAGLAVYEPRGGYVAAVVVATKLILPTARRGDCWLPELLVIYSAGRSIIVSGYQVSSRRTASIPAEAQWLK